MVFAVNAPDYGDKTFDAFLARAKASTVQDPPTTHTIVVGGDPKTVGFTYTPTNITANPGDIVTFKFMVKNHT